MFKNALALLLLTLSLPVWAKTVFVREVEGNATPEDMATIRELVKVAVPKNKGFSTAAEEKTADIKLYPKVLKLGGSYMVSVRKVEGGREYIADMKSKSLDDMDTVTTRVVRSALNEIATEDSGTVKDITADEEFANTRRYQATRQWQLGFGPAWSHGLRNTGGGTAFLLGFTWGLDPHWDINLLWDTYNGRGNNDAWSSSLTLNGTYNVLLGKHTPYVGAGFGWTAMRADECEILNCPSELSGSGWSLSTEGGYRFFRTSTVNVGIGGRYTVLFDKIAGSTPGVFSLRLSVYW